MCRIYLIVTIIIILEGLILTRANATLAEADDDDIDFAEVDDDDYDDSKLRWSMFIPRFVERFCYKNCRSGDKPFSRLVGARCQCLCPINAAVLQLCPPNGGLTSCYDFCRGIGYLKGGECLYNENCFCFCGRNQFYNASVVYTPSILQR